jgi:hypothetical protein
LPQDAIGHGLGGGDLKKVAAAGVEIEVEHHRAWLQIILALSS